MLFEQPLESFINNVIYIDRSNNHKTRLEVVCILFCFLKITSFHTPNSNLGLWRLHLCNRGKNVKKGCLKYSIFVVFRIIFLLLFFGDSWAGNRRRRILALVLAHQKKKKKGIKKEKNSRSHRSRSLYFLGTKLQVLCKMTYMWQDYHWVNLAARIRLRHKEMLGRSLSIKNSQFKRKILLPGLTEKWTEY